MVRFYLRNTLMSPALIIGIMGLGLAMLAGGDFSDDLLYLLSVSLLRRRNGFISK